METVSIAVDSSSEKGVVRRINGLNNAAPLSYIFGSARRDLTEQLKALNCAAIRFHDVVLENPGLELVDISRVFPNGHADLDDSKNYHFEATDDYVANAIATGCDRIEFRLGESIEHSRKQYAVHPPADPERWAEICCHIISHYNEGWANGFHHNIIDWSIWEEPDTVPLLFTGTVEDYCNLYCVTAKMIKERFPAVRVGGPNCCGGNWDLMTQLLKQCRASGAPLDFLACTNYSREPDELIGLVRLMRELLDEHGFLSTEVHISEWHYGPQDWNDIHGDVAPETHVAALAEIAGSNGGAFTASSLIGFQDVPIDMSYYYCCCLNCWGLFDESSRVPTASYYAMRAFGDIARYRTRLATDAHPVPAVRVLAASNGEMKMAVLISCFKAGAMNLNIDFTDSTLDDCMVQVLDATRSLEAEAPDAVRVDGSRLTIKKDAAGSAVYLVTVGGAVSP